MNDQHPPEWEPRLRHLVGRFEYPSTPDIAGAVRPQTHPGLPGTRRGITRRRVLVIIASALLLLVPLATPLRAAVERLWRIGAIEIVVATPVLLHPSIPTPQPTSTERRPTAQPPLFGATTLADAQAHLPFAIPLPTYPADLGQPDQVYVQGDDTTLVLVWFEPDSEEARLSLQIFDSEMIARKLISGSTDVQRTTVDGHQAAWIDVPHVLQYITPNGQPDYREGRFVQGNVLIWATDRLTYRLESRLTLDQARRVAESLR